MESCSNNCTHSWKGFTEGVHQVVLFTVLSFKWSKKKHNLAKILLEMCANFTIILYKNKCKLHSYKYSYKLVFILFFFWESNFQQVGDLRTRNISAFCFSTSVGCQIQ